MVIGATDRQMMAYRAIPAQGHLAGKRRPPTIAVHRPGFPEAMTSGKVGTHDITKAERIPAQTPTDAAEYIRGTFGH